MSRGFGGGWGTGYLETPYFLFTVTLKIFLNLFKRKKKNGVWNTLMAIWKKDKIGSAPHNRVQDKFQMIQKFNCKDEAIADKKKL